MIVAFVMQESDRTWEIVLSVSNWHRFPTTDKPVGPGWLMCSQGNLSGRQTCSQNEPGNASNWEPCWSHNKKEQKMHLLLFSLVNIILNHLYLILDHWLILNVVSNLFRVAMV